jgi:hypothetical protein
MNAKDTPRRATQTPAPAPADFRQFAIAFATALVERDFKWAEAMSGPPRSNNMSADDIKRCYEAMCGDSVAGKPETVFFDPEFSLVDWPAKQPGDVGWAYVTIQGHGMVEAVAVTVAQQQNRLFVRQIEWGRP